ncbi:MAG: acetyl-coenzyme A synthetase N-terminal domain-containing protein, partial [Ignavibacteria bacterium]
MESISSFLQEHRVFSPPQDFALQANIHSIEQYESMRKSANQDPLSHWEQQAKKLHWFTQWETTLDWQYPHAKWF